MEFNYGIGIDKDARIAKNLTELVGHTPMVELGGFAKKENFPCQLVAKLEACNPLGSAKDRVALAMVEDAEQKGILTENTVIIEPTSGNTGVGLAFVAAIKGYKLILTMPENMSAERKNLLRHWEPNWCSLPPIWACRAALTKQTNSPRKPKAHGFPGSSQTPPMQMRTAKPLLPKFCATPTERWTILWPASAPAAQLQAWAK